MRSTEGKDVRSDKDGFRGLWRRLKPADKPDEVTSIYFITVLYIDYSTTGRTVRYR